MKLFKGKEQEFLLKNTDCGIITVSETALSKLLADTLKVTSGIMNVRIVDITFSTPGMSYVAEVTLTKGSHHEKVSHCAKKLVRKVLKEREGVPVFSQELTIKTEMK